MTDNSHKSITADSPPGNKNAYKGGHMKSRSQHPSIKVKQGH